MQERPKPEGDLEKRNSNLFAWTVADMPEIDPNFSGHKLSILHGSKPVAQKLRRMSLEKVSEIKK
ncbi:hypothetical protein PIB30_000063 [Stylosanthes scabra]|uniref:Uncharacterized protein n=1 Tax=Stylosanthes scabra TaxID=79078 RepID=A0ABU6Q1Z4_9FABA|nr:hypothetical protein [Stylosanthes scabra]